MAPSYPLITREEGNALRTTARSRPGMQIGLRWLLKPSCCGTTATHARTPGLRVGKTGNVLRISDKDRVVEEIRIGEICQLNLFGSIQLTTQAIQTLCEMDVPIAYFSMGGWFYGLTRGMGQRNVSLRRAEFRLADDREFCLLVARALTAGKIRNQRTLLQRNHTDPPSTVMNQQHAHLARQRPHPE